MHGKMTWEQNAYGVLILNCEKYGSIQKRPVRAIDREFALPIPYEGVNGVLQQSRQTLKTKRGRKHHINGGKSNPPSKDFGNGYFRQRK